MPEGLAEILQNQFAKVERLEAKLPGIELQVGEIVTKLSLLESDVDTFKQHAATSVDV